MSFRLAFLMVVASGPGCQCDKDKQGHSQQHQPAVVAPLRAALDAPEGKTPCESAHNALIAIDEGSAKANMPAPWPVLPKREEFLDVCGRLPAETQRCLFPRYHSQHHDVCVERIEEMKADEWGKIIFKMINADGSANKPAAAVSPGAGATSAKAATSSQ